MTFSITLSTRNSQQRHFPQVHRGCFVFSLVLFVAAPGLVHADLVKLINGGELRGKIVPAGNTKQMIRMETITGAVVVVEKNQTQFVTIRSQAVEEYETKARRLGEADDNWENHWELAEWCRQRSLTVQRETHLRRVVDLFPDHDKAQTALGRVWHQGKWIDRDELMVSKGFVKYKNKYITPQELEIIEKTTEESQRDRSWFQKVRLWHGWLDGSHDDRFQQAITGFNGIDDPHAATAVIKFLSGDSRVSVRELCAKVLIKIGGSKAILGLVNLALFDESWDVRLVALNGIGPEYCQQAQSAFAQALKNQSNAVVCRAATALGQIGDKKVVGSLIDALVTAHTYQVTSDIPLNQTYSFATDGSLGSNGPTLPPSVMAAVRTGQMLPPIVLPTENPLPKKTVTVRVEHYNSEVLAALEKLTQQNFGYDKRTWNLWWSAEKNQGTKSAK